MKYSKELMVGASLLLAGVIFVLGVRYLEDIPLLRGTYDLATTFETVNGLNQGSAVRVNGVRVGAVETVELDPTGSHVHVRFHLDEGVRVPEGSFATIAGIAALASIHVNVHLGPQENPAIPEGGFIPGEEQDDVLGMVTERGPALASQVEEVLASANQALDGADALMEGADANVRPTLLALRQATEALSQTLRAEQQTIHETMSNLEAFSADMAAFSDANSDSLAVAVQALNRSMAQLDRSLATLDRSTLTLDEILAKVNTGEGTLARLVNDPSLYVRMDSTFTSMQALIEEMRRDPEKYLRHMALVDLF